MHHITFYLDFISPYAHLAFHALPQALQGHSYQVTHKPVVFGAVLKHLGQLGPAEIAGKRDWTYRQVLWHARTQGLPMRMPATHPFNPLGLLRLAVACDAAGTPNRQVCETLFNHVWHTGLEAADAERLAQVQAQLAPQRDPQDEAVKQQLKAHTDEALALGVFGVPMLVVDGQLFWGFDALPMLRAYLDGDDWFQTDAWKQVGKVPTGITRRTQ